MIRPLLCCILVLSLAGCTRSLLKKESPVPPVRHKAEHSEPQHEFVPLADEDDPEYQAYLRNQIRMKRHCKGRTDFVANTREELADLIEEAIRDRDVQRLSDYASCRLSFIPEFTGGSDIRWAPKEKLVPLVMDHAVRMEWAPAQVRLGDLSYDDGKGGHYFLIFEQVDGGFAWTRYALSGGGTGALVQEVVERAGMLE